MCSLQSLPHRRVQPCLPPGSLLVPQMRLHARQALLVPGGHRSPHPMSSPSLLLRDSTPVWLMGDWYPSVLSLCHSGKSDHFSLSFNCNFLCKGFCHPEDVWHTLYQYLYRYIFLKNDFSMWVYGPKDDTTCGNNCQRLNERDRKSVV